MSLPSYAHFYNGEVFVGSLFCNIGWVYNELQLPPLVKEILDYNDEYKNEEQIGRILGIVQKGWDSVCLYGEVYSKEDLEKLEILRQKEIEESKNRKKSSDPFEKILIPIIRKLPDGFINAVDICEVQPMQNYTGHIFSIKVREPKEKK